MFTRPLDQCSKEPKMMSDFSAKPDQNQSYSALFNQPRACQYSQLTALSMNHTHLHTPEQQWTGNSVNYLLKNCLQKPIKESINEFMPL